MAECIYGNRLVERYKRCCICEEEVGGVFFAYLPNNSKGPNMSSVDAVKSWIDRNISRWPTGECNLPVKYCSWPPPPQAPPPTPKYTLTIKSAVGGTTDPAAGSYVYQQGEVATVYAKPYSNYDFDYWMYNNTKSTVNPVKLTVTKDITLVPTFKAKPITPPAPPTPPTAPPPTPPTPPTVPTPVPTPPGKEPLPLPVGPFGIWGFPILKQLSERFPPTKTIFKIITKS